MGKVAFLFSGQGAQFPGMMHEYYDALPSARHVFDVADEVLKRPISKICFEGPQEELNLTHNTQPCVLAADLAAYAAACDHGLKPEGFAGFSLGEYAALVAAGCIAMEDAFLLVQKRADAMQEAVPVGNGAMAVVMKLTAEEVEALCEEVAGYVVCANYNSPLQTVVSGEVEAVDRLLGLCKSHGVRAMKIPVSAPSHCVLMASAANRLEEAISDLLLNSPRLPVYMNVDASALTIKDELALKMVAQVVSPVLWRQTLEKMWNDGFDAFLECGPGTTLSGFVRRTIPNAEILKII